MKSLPWSCLCVNSESIARKVFVSTDQWKSRWQGTRSALLYGTLDFKIIALQMRLYQLLFHLVSECTFLNLGIHFYFKTNKWKNNQYPEEKNMSFPPLFLKKKNAVLPPACSCSCIFRNFKMIYSLSVLPHSSCFPAISLVKS